MSAFFHAIPVASRGIEVQTGGNPLFPASLFHQPAVGAGNAVIQSVDEEHRRRLLRHLSLRGTHLLQGRGWMGPQYFVARSPVGSMGRHGNDGINKHGKIRTGGNVFQRIFRFFRQGAVPQRRGHGRQMAASGKAHDADAKRVNSQGRGVFPHGPQSLAGVQQGTGKLPQGIAGS